ncbi:MAG: hypothetical protein JOZ18_12510 [Chloroflexi bacterium]|nr:hypothetical protein [Chloroflexota bacterium]
MESWFVAGSHPQDYELGIDTITTYQGKNSAYIKSAVAEPEGFATIRQVFKADKYRNKRLRFSGMIKSEGVEGQANLWMRVNGPKESLSFDNMKNRPIKGTTDWQKYELVLDAPEVSVFIAFGFALEGKGQVWLSDVHFEAVETDIPVTGYPQEYPDEPANLDFAQ